MTERTQNNMTTDDTKEVKLLDLADLSTTDDYQHYPNLADEEYNTLKKSIESDGVQSPIHVDTEYAILDGHHRVKASRAVGKDTIPAFVRDGLTEEEKHETAYMLNSGSRNLDDQLKKEVILHCFRDHIDRETHVTDTKVAELCGASQPYVHEVKENLSDKEYSYLYSLSPQMTDKKVAREYIEEHPDQSARKAAENLPMSQPTVSKLKKEHDSLLALREGTDSMTVVERAKHTDRVLSGGDDWTQKKLAGEIGVSRHAIYSWMQPTQWPEWDSGLSSATTKLFNQAGSNKIKVVRTAIGTENDGMAVLSYTERRGVSRKLLTELKGELSEEPTAKEVIRAFEPVRDYSDESEESASDDDSDAGEEETPTRTAEPVGESTTKGMSDVYDDDGMLTTASDTDDETEATVVVEDGQSDADDTDEQAVVPIEDSEDSLPSGVRRTPSGSLAVSQSASGQVDTDIPDTLYDQTDEVIIADNVADDKLFTSADPNNPQIIQGVAMPSHPDGYTDEHRQALKKQHEETSDRWDRILADPEVQKNGQVLHNIAEHLKAYSLAISDIRCPECGGGPQKIRWTCCDISLQEGRALAEEAAETQFESYDDEEVARRTNSHHPNMPKGGWEQ